MADKVIDRDAFQSLLYGPVNTMRGFTFQTRHLCLLALFQLLAGPLVLLQVCVFCSLTVREVPSQGVAGAVVKAWNSESFQTLLSSDSGMVVAEKGTLPAKQDSNEPHLKPKFNGLSWEHAAHLRAPAMSLEEWNLTVQVWTPSWSQAPPGPPPRAC